MNKYEFTLRFSLPGNESDVDAVVERLYSEGCDDSIAGTGVPGRIALMFTREAASAEEAMLSAIRDARRAMPDSKLIEAGPDYVGLSDIADFFGFTRQNMRKLMLSYPTTFPLAVHEGSTAIWHLADVLDWFQHHRNRRVAAAKMDVAVISMRLNVAREFCKNDVDLLSLVSDKGWNTMRETLSLTSP
ncbi:MAG: DNA-binding protein [Gammaproteobacteria bacterium]|nr:DNA-binding protein [Gammaproteobacteria bacterium]